jgi:hypothetical protein
MEACQVLQSVLSDYWFVLSARASLSSFPARFRRRRVSRWPSRASRLLFHCLAAVSGRGGRVGKRDLGRWTC